MPRDLEADQAMLRNVLSLAEAREFQRAGAIADEALEGGFEHPLLFNVVATLREMQGRYDEAARLLERAVVIAPDDVGCRNALALVLQRLDRAEEALHHVDELLRRHPDLGFAHANRGNALIALGKLGQARLSHLRALELEPGNLVAFAALASIATRRGEHDEARGWAERALALAPGFPDPIMSLAAADLAAGDLAMAERRLRALLADGRVAPADRARAYGLLGDVQDAAGRYADAFKAYAACNELLRQVHRRFGSGTTLLEYTRALTAATRAAAPSSWAVPAPKAPAVPQSGAAGHVFLMGFPRSGTTLLEVALDGHPAVASAEELELLTDSVLRFMREPLDLRALAKASDAELAPLRAAYWTRVRSAGIDVAGKVFVDKHPLNTLKLPLIARLFPEARVLFALRDPRDVVLSCFRRRFKMNAAMYELLTLGGAAAFYDAVMGYAEQLRPTLGLAWQSVRHEDLVADFDAGMRGICNFIGVPWVEGLGDFGGRVQTREQATPSTAQLSRGLDASGIGHWRHYAPELEPIALTLGYWVRGYAYPP